MKNNIFCKECKFIRGRLDGNPYCACPSLMNKIISKNAYEYKIDIYDTDPRKINKNNDCLYFKQANFFRIFLTENMVIADWFNY